MYYFSIRVECIYFESISFNYTFLNQLQPERISKHNSMRLFSVFLVLVCLATNSFGQKIKLKTPFKYIQHSDDFELYENGIYCAGYSFNTALNDGNSSDAYIEKYDKETLKLQWSTKINNKYSNKVNAIIGYNNKLYALVTQGKIQPLTQDVYLCLYTLNLNGEIEDTVHVGKSFSRTTHFVKSGDLLVFGYQISDGIRYSSKSYSVIARFNTSTKKLDKFKSEHYISGADKILINKTDYYLFGQYIEPNLPNVLVCKNGKLSEIHIKHKLSEYFIDSYISDSILTIVCVFPGTYENKSQYLRYYYMNLNTKVITNKTIPYKNYGWSEIRFDAYSIGSSTWVIVEEAETEKLKYVQIDNKGTVLSSFEYQDGNGYAENFILENNLLINESKGRIMIMNYKE